MSLNVISRKQRLRRLKKDLWRERDTRKSKMQNKNMQTRNGMKDLNETYKRSKNCIMILKVISGIIFLYNRQLTGMTPNKIK